MRDPVSILIVDDFTPQRMSIEAALSDLGENLVSVGSGREALKFLMDHEAAVVLLDVNMPDMDGFETASLIRQRPRNTNTPIIFLTADHDAMRSARGYALGAVDYLTCPFVPDVLRTKVKVFVSLSRAQSRIRKEADQRVALLKEQAARTAAEEQSRRLRLLSEAGGALMRSLDRAQFEEELLRILVPELAHEAGLEFAEGSEQHGSVMWLRARDGAIEAGAVPSGHLAEAAVKTARTSAPQMLDADPKGCPRCLVLPIAVPGHIDAALAVARHGDAPGFSAEECELIGLIAGRTAVALDNRRLYRELQERDRRKDEFLAMLSHELRNPLGAITSAASLLQMVGSVDDRSARASNVITRQSAHLTRLVDDLLEVSRVTVGHITLDRSPMDLRELADKTLDTLRASCRLDQHRVVVRGESVMVEADPARMEQVLTNLIINAVKYTDPGGHIEVVVDSDEGVARVRVTDDGIGIAPELLTRMFDVFVQGGQALDRAKGGLGIGLTLVRRLMELQGGTARAFSEGLGKGTTLVIELPRLPREFQQRPSEKREGSVGASMSVLVVDDNDDVRVMLRTYLELGGHQVHEAATGPEAVEAAVRIQPALALVDIGLPGFDGFEVSRRLRDDARTRHIVLIAITGYGRADDREKTTALGFAAHLVKPVTPERLEEVFALARPLASRERLAAAP